MGNLVSNKLYVTAGDLSSEASSFKPVVCKLTAADPNRIIADLEAAFLANPADPAWTDVALDFGVTKPLPEGLDEVDEHGTHKEFLLAMAILSTKVDYVALRADHRDPMNALMPPEHQETRVSILSRAGLLGRSNTELRKYGVDQLPDAMRQASASIRHFNEHGAFDSLTWRRMHWGVRAHAEKAWLRIEKSSLGISFDTVNNAAAEWTKEFAAALPEFEVRGAAYDQDNDYSFFIEPVGPGEVLFDEQWDEDKVTLARAIVAGLTVDDIANLDIESDDYEP